MKGVVMAGPVVPGHGLFVALHNPDGSVLSGPVRVNDDSTFTLQVRGTLQGPLLARVVDSHSAADYMDEALQRPIDLAHDLRAAFVSSGEATLTIVISPLTDLVVRRLGLAPSLPNADGTSAAALGDITAEQILQANADMAQRFGLENGLFVLPSLVIDTQGQPTAEANFSGHILAALSGLQELHGAELAMDYPLAASDLVDSAQLQALLIAGTQMAAPTGVINPLANFVAAAAQSPFGQAITTAIKNAQSMTDAQLGALDRTGVATLALPVLAAMMPEQLGKLSKDAVAGLGPAQLQVIGSKQLNHLANQGKLSKDQLSSLSDTQLAALFPPAKLDPVIKAGALNPDGTISPDAIGPGKPPLLSGTLPTPLPTGAKVAIYDGLTHLGDAVVGPDGKSWTFTPDSLEPGPHDFSAHVELGGGKSVASASFDSDSATNAAQNLSAADLAALTRDTSARIPKPVLAALTPEQLAMLNPDAVAGLSPDQLKALDIPQLIALASAGNLSADQINSLSDTQLNALFPPADLEPVVTSDANGAIDPNTSSRDSTPTVSGVLPVKLPAGATVGIFDGSTRLGDAIVQADGVTWSFTPGPLSNGSHTLSAHVELPGGKTIASNPFPFDVLVPTLAVTIDTPKARAFCS